MISATIKGLSVVKASMPSKLCKEEHCHCMCLQETHRGERDDPNVKSIPVTAANHVEVITAELPDVVVNSVYKPASEQFVLPTLGQRSLPQIVIGDFNSHNTIWYYDAIDNNRHNITLTTTQVQEAIQ